MKRLKAKNVYYEIEKLLGDGLTSEVYKAFRIDGRGLTKQPVALKIIKSKNDVQILKREFEHLTRIKSKYCVRILAWENLPQGPSLVLEYIDGFTLDQVVKNFVLGLDEVHEILAQVYLGLLALHRTGFCHGDLNLKNIMVTKEGMVKLIDFGIAEKGEAQLVTLSFASESRLAGNSPTYEDDFVSLTKISEHLANKVGVSEPISWKKQSTKPSRRRNLSQLLNQSTSSPFQTRRISFKQNDRPKSRRFSTIVNVVTFLAMLWCPPYSYSLPEFVELDLRSKNWFQYSINNLPAKFGPTQIKKLRKGTYNLKFKMEGVNGSKSLKLSKPRTILLKPGDKLL